jgi:hypothetical protein
MDNIGLVCPTHASKPGAFTGKDPKTFVGKYVKLGFPATDPRTKLPSTEHMWVKVEGLHEEGLHGVVNNDPVLDCEYSDGSGVAFGVDEIEAVYEEP